MIPDVFLDTNILIYAASGRYDEPRKYAIAQGLLTSNFGTSGQVLAEFFANVTRKGAAPLDRVQARAWINNLVRKPVQPIDSNLVTDAIDLSDRYQISCWDGAIVAAAQRLGVKTLYTEDLSHQQAYGSVTAINPFI
ncbi:PIN domain-containing protein [bacterium]|nr:PIN domain-containing protein [bacterium]